MIINQNYIQSLKVEIINDQKNDIDLIEEEAQFRFDNKFNLNCLSFFENIINIENKLLNKQNYVSNIKYQYYKNFNINNEYPYCFVSLDGMSTINLNNIIIKKNKDLEKIKDYFISYQREFLITLKEGNLFINTFYPNKNILKQFKYKEEFSKQIQLAEQKLFIKQFLNKNNSSILENSILLEREDKEFSKIILSSIKQDLMYSKMRELSTLIQEELNNMISNQNIYNSECQQNINEHQTNRYKKLQMYNDKIQNMLDII